MRILSLLYSKNYGRMVYAICERVFNFPLPKCIARLIAKFNKKKLRNIDINLIMLETYEGSNQAVHPDVLQWKDKTFLVCTPYPYGNNRCENPSVYCGDNLYSLKPACSNPIDYPSSKTAGSILSDPCFFLREDKLFICYRERIQSKNDVKYHLHIQSSTDGNNWIDKKTIISSITKEDPLISPAIINYNGADYLYHVRARGLGGDIVLSLLTDSFDTKEIGVLECEGLPEGFVIWHIGLHSDQYTKSVAQGQKILGLLTVRNGIESRVYKAHQDNPTDCWIIDEQLEISDVVKKYCKEVYKCSYTPDGKVVLSFFDNQNRLLLTIV